MTTALMLARLRTLLDESAAGFWTETEEYAALSDGQKELSNIVFQKNPHSQILKPLLSSKSGTETTGTEIDLPDDFKAFMNAKWSTVTTSTQYPCRIVNYDAQFIQDKNNTYLAPMRASPVIYVVGSTFSFEPVSTVGDYSSIYLSQTTDIDGSTEPILLAEAHESIVIYAFSFLLRKDLRAQEADGVYKTFLDMAGKL